MKSKIVRIAALVLALMMVFALTGCGDKKNEAKAPEPKYGFKSPVEGDALKDDAEMQTEGKKLEQIVLDAGLEIKKITYTPATKDSDPRLTIYVNHIDGVFLRRMTNRNNNIQVGASSEFSKNAKTYVDLICKYLGADDSVATKLSKFTNRDSGYVKINGVEYYAYCSYIDKKDMISHNEYTLNK